MTGQINPLDPNEDGKDRDVPAEKCRVINGRIHCNDQPYPFRLNTSCFDAAERIHPKSGESLTNSWADKDRVTRLAIDAWNIVSGFMNEHSERILPVGAKTVIRVTKIHCGFRVERFEQIPDRNGWPINAHTGGFNLQGPCAGIENEPECYSITPVKPGSLRSIDFKDEILQQLADGVRIVDSMQHVVHMTHGHHQLNLVKGSVYEDTGGQNEFINRFAQALANLNARSTVFNRGGYDASKNSAKGDPHSGWEFTSNLAVGVVRVEDAMSARWERKEDMGPYLDALAYDIALWLGREKLDVLIAHYWDGVEEAAKVRKMLNADVPLVWVPHSLGEHKRRNERASAKSDEEYQHRYEELNLTERIDREQRMLDQEIDLVASTSRELTEILINFHHYPRERIYELSPGYDDDVYQPVVGKELWLPNDPSWNRFAKEILANGKFPPYVNRHWLENEAVFITEVSRTDETKNKDVILKAMDIASRKNSKLVLLINIAASEPDSLGQELRESLAELQRNNPQLCVAAFPNPSDDCVRLMHMVASAYVSMSKQEGFGMSLLNAAASGKASIFTPAIPFGVEDLLGESPVKREDGVVVGEAGIMVPLGNEELLAKSILELTGNQDLRKRMGIAAHKRAEPYSWTACTKKFLSALDCLTGADHVDFTSLKKNFPRRKDAIN